MGRRPEHLLRRGTKWYLRVRVPDELRGVIGKGEIWRSLRTSDAAAARGLVRTERLKLEAEFDDARRAMKAAELASPRPKLPVLSEAEVWQLTARFFASRERQSSEPLDPDSVAIRTE